MACLEIDEVYDIRSESGQTYTFQFDKSTCPIEPNTEKIFYLSNIPWHLKFGQSELKLLMDAKVPKAMASMIVEIQIVEKMIMRSQLLKFDGWLFEWTLSEINMDEIIKITISISKAKGLFAISSFVHSTNESDVVFKIGDKKVRANKQILSFYSPVFHAILNSRSREKVIENEFDFLTMEEIEEFYIREPKEEIELKGVDVNDFLDLLRIVYPQRTTPFNRVSEFRQSLLDLGDRFQMQSVIDYCEKCLMEDTQICAQNFIEKLVFASKFGMFQRMDQIMKFIREKELRSSDFRDQDAFKDSPDTIKLFILSNFLEELM